VTSKNSSSGNTPVQRRSCHPIRLLGGAVLLGVLGAVRAATVYNSDHTQINLYGIVDLGVGYLQHSYPASDLLASTVNPYNLNASPNSFTGMFSSGTSMSRVGLGGRPNSAPARRCSSGSRPPSIPLPES
jgi:hypothetical protein